VAVVGVTIGLSAFAGSSANAAPATPAAKPAELTQLDFVKYMTKVTGAAGQFGPTSTAQDYINWATSQGLAPKNGWNMSEINKKLDRNRLAEMLSFYLGLNDKKAGGDYIKLLQRDGIDVPDSLDRASAVTFFDDFKASSHNKPPSTGSPSHGKPPHHGKPPGHGHGGGDGDGDGHSSGGHSNGHGDDGGDSHDK